MRAERTPHRSRPRLLAGLAVCAALIAPALLPGCAMFDHHWKVSEYVGRPLSTRSAEGMRRLQGELEHDAKVAAWVEEHGRPDYLYLESRTKLYVFHLASDDAAMFERPLPMTTELTELGRIPGSLLELLPRDEQQRVLAARAHEARAAQSRGQARKRAIRRHAPPAARHPGAATFGGFPTARIVERMRPPLTAADPGVSGWRRGRLRGGGTVYSAKVGSTRYEVRSDRVAFTVRLPRSARYVPEAARLAMQRVNNAVFATRADRVTELMMTLAERAAADRSGRTHYAKRVAGRTIRVGRRVDAGVLTYSVHP